MSDNSKDIKRVHLLAVPFTGLGRHNGYRGDTWLANRIKVFTDYVLPSLTNQTNKNFIIWVAWRPEEKENPQVRELWKLMDNLESMRTVFTFGGTFLYDDKYPHEVAKDRLITNISRFVPELKSYVDWADEVLVTCQPSDDMFLSHTVKTIQEFPWKDEKAIGWTKGYIINYATKELAEYNPDTTPPFATIRYPRDVFLDTEKHYEWIKDFKSHEDVVKLGFKELEGRGFIVGTHQENISTTWNIPYKGLPVHDDMVLFKAGIYFSPPIIQKPNKRIIARKIYNYLPFKPIIRFIYKKLYV